MRKYAGGGFLGFWFLSVFFAQSGLSAEAPTKTPTCVTSACHGDYLKLPVVHRLLKSGKCTLCHNLDDGKNTKNTPKKVIPGQPNHPRFLPLTGVSVNKVCFSCHDDVRDELERNKGPGTSAHRPIFEQSCVACHNPHGAKNKGLFNEKKSPDLCFTCHKEIAEIVKSGAVKHSIVTEKDACLTCHAPHSAAEPSLNKSRTTDLCLSCHNREQKTKDGRVIRNVALDAGKSAPSHKAILDMQCSTCHNPHGSNLEHLLKLGPFVFNRVPKADAKAAECVECHSTGTPMAVKTWSGSLHAQVGVTCVTCHEVKKEDPGYDHHDVRISMIVSPKVCGTCHKNEVAEMAKSSHGTAIPGREVKQTNGKPDSKSWPMPPVGRINPDGSVGSCTICHGRHDFQAENARQPNVCISCHSADGSAEAWSNSAHGAAYRDLKSSPKNFAAGGTIKLPTCVTCHMSDNGSGGRLTHDVTARLNWKLNGTGGKSAVRTEGSAHRDVMVDTCTQCHGSTFVEDAFLRIDESIRTGKPNQSLPAALPHLSPTERSRLKGE